MDFFLIGLVAQVAIFFLAPPAVRVYSITKGWASGIAAPSPNNTDIPGSPASNISNIEDSCLVSDFISTLWSCPSATATVSATATTITTSTPVFSPSYTPKQATLAALAPGLPIAYILCIAGLVAFFTVLNICIKYSSRQVNGAQRPVDTPEESLLSCWDSILDGTYYEWRNSDSLGSTVDFSNHVLDAAVREWHDEKARQAEVKWNDREKAHQIQINNLKLEHDKDVAKKLESEARERDLQEEIESMKAEFDDKVKGLEVELAARKRALEAKITEIKEQESDHRAQIATKEREHKDELAAKESAHQVEINSFNDKQKRVSDKVRIFARIRHRLLLEEINKRKAAERKYDAVQNGLVGMLFNTGLLGSGLPKPTAQDAAPGSTTEQLLLAPATAESSPAEPASPVATPAPELDSSEPKAETSPQDVAPGNGDQLPSSAPSTEGLITEAKDASRVAIDRYARRRAFFRSAPPPFLYLPTSLPPLRSIPPSLSPSESGAEQQQHHAHEEHEHEHYEDALEQQDEQKEGLEEQEPQYTELPLHEPSSMGEGAEQSHQEKDIAHDAPVPTEEQAASPQLTEPEAAPGHTTSSDGAFEAPVTTEVLPEEQAGDRETEEPTAVEESVEAPGTTSSNDGASTAPVPNETKTVRFVDGNGREVRTAEVDQTPPGLARQAVPDEPADETAVEKGPATTDRLADSSKWEWGGWPSSLLFINAVGDDLDDEAEVESSNGKPLYSMYGLELSSSEGASSEGADKGNGVKQSGSVPGMILGEAEYRSFIAALAGLSIEQPIGGSINNATIDPSARQSNPVSGEASSSGAIYIDGGDATANDTGAGQSDMATGTLSDPRMDVDTAGDAANDFETMSSAQPGEEPSDSHMHDDGNSDATNAAGSQPIDVGDAEMADAPHQDRGNSQGLPTQINNTPATETAQFPYLGYRKMHDRFRIGVRRGLPRIATSNTTQPLGGQGRVDNNGMSNDVDTATEPAKAISRDEVDKAKNSSTAIETSETSPLAEQDYGTERKDEREKALQNLPSEQSDSELDDISDEELNKMGEEVEKSGELSEAKPVEQAAVESSPAKSGEQPRGDSGPAPPQKVLIPVSRLETASSAQPQLQAQGVQSTQVPSQSTQQPSHTGENTNFTQQDLPQKWAQDMNNWARKVACDSWYWVNSPECAGLDGDTFQQARNDPNSDFSMNILHAANWARYLKTDMKNDLKGSPLSAGAQALFRHTVPAVRGMREHFGVLSQGRGRPDLFEALLRDIDCILRELSVLVPESPTPPAQPQQPQRPRVVNNPLLEKKPLDAAEKILDFVQDGKSKCSRWEPRLQDGGTDADSFRKMTNYTLSPLWDIVRNMSHAADYLEHEGKTLRTPETDLLYRSSVLPAAESMRVQYEDLGTLKKCPQFFEVLLGNVDRVLFQLRELEKSSTPAAQRQPPAQSTQRVPSQPTPQTAGTRQRSGNALHAAMEIKKDVQAIGETYLLWEPNTRKDRKGNITSRGTDRDDFVHWHNDPNSRFSVAKLKIRQIAHWLENRGERFLEAEVMLREQVKPLVKRLRDKANYLGAIKGSVDLFKPMMDDLIRIVKELDKIN